MRSFKHIEARARRVVDRLDEGQCRRIGRGGPDGVVLALRPEDVLTSDEVQALREAIARRCRAKAGLQQAG